MKTISLDLHDLSVENNNIYYLQQLKDLYPDFKVSVFYIPADVMYFKSLMPEMKLEAKKLLRKCVNDGWMELIPHGITHFFGEFAKAKYKDMELALKAYDEHFKELELPYVKGFCAPNWLISQEGIDCLNDNKWWLAIDRNQPESLTAWKNYIYNWSIDEPFPYKKQHILGHGHISNPSKNNLPDCLVNLCSIPQTYTWQFVSEIMGGKHGNDKT